MSTYSYTVDVDISAASADISVDPISIEDGSRNVRSIQFLFDPLSTQSRNVDIETNTQWLNSVSRDTIVIPTDNMRFFFDVSNPDCYPGSGGTLFDLSGNNRNCEIRQLSTNEDNAPSSGANGVADDSGTLLDSFESSSNSVGSYISLNKDASVNTKYLRWQAPSDVPSNFTVFIVASGENIANYSDVEDPDFDGTIVGDVGQLRISTRGGGGFQTTTVQTSNKGRFNYGEYVDNVPDPQYVYYIQYKIIHTLYTILDYRIFSQGRYFLQDSTYTDAFLAAYSPDLGEDMFTALTEPGGVGNFAQRLRFSPLTPNVFSVTYEGNKARTYLDGQFIGERDVSSSRADSTSGTWISGVFHNTDSTLRETDIQRGDMYAWGFYDRTLTEEEHLNIHKKYRQDINPFKEVDLLGYPSYVQFNVLDDFGRPDLNVDIPLNQGATKSHEITLDLSSASADVSVNPKYKMLWSFKSDFSTATSNEFPMIPYELFDGQKEELYNFSYNQVGPDGEDGWLKIELKRDYKVGNGPHASGGIGDGFGPFHLRTLPPEEQDQTNDGGPNDASTAFKWTTEFDDYISKGFDGQPTDPIYTRISYKISYSELPAEELSGVVPVSPMIRIMLNNFTFQTAKIGFPADQAGIVGTLLLNASHDSPFPELVNSFLEIDKTILCGLDLNWYPGISYSPLLLPDSYPPLNTQPPSAFFSSEEWSAIIAPWHFTFEFMRHSTPEVTLDQKVLPQGFHIMLKDLNISSFTGPAGLGEVNNNTQESRVFENESEGPNRKEFIVTSESNYRVV